MHALLLLLLVATPAVSGNISTFLDSICRQGFNTTTMPRGEAARFCSCVIEDVAPRLSSEQRQVLTTAQDELSKGRTPSADRFASSGVRDLVVAGQARCEAAFYPPSAPIKVVASPLELTLRCEDETKKPEAFVYIRGTALLSKSELRALTQRMMQNNFESEYAKVTTAIDGGSKINENWEIDIAGEIVSPPNSAQFIERLRRARTLSIKIERGSKQLAGTFQVTGKIPARWAPCVGVTK
jgi:hypothetical protein